MIIVEVIGSLPGHMIGERVGFHSESRVRELTTCRPPAVRVIEVKPDVVLQPSPISEFLQNKFNLNPDGTPRQAKPVEPPPVIKLAPVEASAAPKADALELLSVPAKAAAKKPQAK